MARVYDVGPWEQLREAHGAVVEAIEDFEDLLRSRGRDVAFRELAVRLLAGPLSPTWRVCPECFEEWEED